MDFFIKKYSVSKPLKIEILKVGRDDYNQIMSNLDNLSVKFSMKNADNGRYVILNDDAIIKGDYIYYYFNKKHTKNIGTYIGEFNVTFMNDTFGVSDSSINLPINEELYINIIDSISNDKLCCKQDGNFEFINLTETARLTPTPTPTSTQTPTPTQTSTQTPTPTQTQTQTPSNTQTPTPSTSIGASPQQTPTPTKTPSSTQNITPTPSSSPIIEVTPTSTNIIIQTPSSTPQITPTPTQSEGAVIYSKGYLLVEPDSQNEFVSNYLANNGATSPDFRGFGYLFLPQTTLSIQLYMGLFSSQVNSSLLIYELDIPQNTQFGSYLFDTITIPIGTVNESAWYTFFIPDESMGGNILTSVKYGISEQTLNTNISTEPTMYNFGPVQYNEDGIFVTGNYRIYTTWPSPGLKLSNINNDLVFRGGSL